ncbi:MAG: hypothetical protein WA020_04195 [Candidatus Acidiferrales bacterium]
MGKMAKASTTTALLCAAGLFSMTAVAQRAETTAREQHPYER